MVPTEAAALRLHISLIFSVASISQTGKGTANIWLSLIYIFSQRMPYMPFNYYILSRKSCLLCTKNNLLIIATIKKGIVGWWNQFFFVTNRCVAYLFKNTSLITHLFIHVTYATNMYVLLCSSREFKSCLYILSTFQDQGVYSFQQRAGMVAENKT